VSKSRLGGASTPNALLSMKKLSAKKGEVRSRSQGRGGCEDEDKMKKKYLTGDEVQWQRKKRITEHLCKSGTGPQRPPGGNFSKEERMGGPHYWGTFPWNE